jgi:hypothetical protein
MVGSEINLYLTVEVFGIDETCNSFDSSKDRGLKAYEFIKVLFGVN